MRIKSIIVPTTTAKKNTEEAEISSLSTDQKTEILSSSHRISMNAV